MSDRDTIFFNAFWTIIWEKMDTKLKRSIVFHPHIDGQINAINRTLVHILMGYN
jgi:hypothetical protein